LSYAKRSLQPLESLKLPPKPIMYTDTKSWKRRFHNILRSINLEYLIQNNFKVTEKKRIRSIISLSSIRNFIAVSLLNK